jgi:hypothetical protein
MNEANAFLAMFAIQILAGSILYPAWLIRHVRAKLASFPVERFAELFPGVDQDQSARRFATRHRALNTCIAVIGLLLLRWLFRYMQDSGWRDGPVEALATVYFLAQMSPVLRIGWVAHRYNKMLKHSLAEPKRRAVLQRRRLFDFVSPFVVFLAGLTYFVMVALVLYIRQHPFPGFGGFLNIGITTLVYALNASVVYWWLYGRKRNPLETHADRIQATGVVVRTLVYSCIVVTVFQSLTLTLGLLQVKRWGPFALSSFFVICTLISSLGVIAPPRQKKGDGLGPDGSLPPGAPDLSA